jgi:tetratricopeptide (TPR) repeat protein
MKQPIRSLSLICAFMFVLLFLSALPALAQESAEEQAAKEEAKERAKQARIEEYLRKKEERRARREMQSAKKVIEEEAEETAAAAMTEAPAETEAEALAKPKKQPKQKKAKAKKTKPQKVYMPRGLARVQESIREGDIGQDPTVRAYLDLIDRGEASPYQLAAFGNFLSQNGRTRDAMEYYSVALGMEKNDPVLWMNVGTLHRQLQEFSMAASAYSKALSIEPTNAFAHYNLGSVLDEMGKYEDAIVEYKEALTLDPTLGDPAYNPAAANNEKLLAVKLMLYREQTGGLGLPLMEVPKGDLEAAGEEPEPER